jgi:hypothetical protein
MNAQVDDLGFVLPVARGGTVGGVAPPGDRCLADSRMTRRAISSTYWIVGTGGTSFERNHQNASSW